MLSISMSQPMDWQPRPLFAMLNLRDRVACICVIDDSSGLRMNDRARFVIVQVRTHGHVQMAVLVPSTEQTSRFKQAFKRRTSCSGGSSREVQVWGISPTKGKTDSPRFVAASHASRFLGRLLLGTIRNDKYRRATVAK
jgi:hypothetical protein